MLKVDTILQEVIIFLQKKHWTVATAESCTGGMLAQYLTQRSGSSHWFDRGWVTYSNAAKQDELNVSNELLQEYGAVSEEVAKAMALGALHHSAANIAVSITGIAGPEGGTPDKPTGTVCFGWASLQGDCLTKRVQWPAFSRERIRYLSCYDALAGIIALG